MYDHVSLAQRVRLANHAATLVHFAPQIHYAEVRPMRSDVWPDWRSVIDHLGSGGTLTMDCSEAVTALFRWSGLRDPNGCGYDGYGYTGDMLNHLPHYTETQDAHIGALGVFGDWPGTHVVMVIHRNGNNPWVFSHGSEAGPFRITLDDEWSAHAGQSLTWLNIGGL